MSSAGQAVFPALDNTIGALLIGLILSTMLYGILSLQTYIYYYIQSDTWILKWLVGVLWLINTAHEAVICHAVYYYLISNYFNPAALAVGTWSLCIQTSLNALVTLIVQCFFAYRVQRFSSARGIRSLSRKNSLLITGVIVFLTCVQFGFGCAFTVRAFALRKFTMMKEAEQVAGVALASSTACDLLIAASLCYLLNKNKTGFNRTNTLINSLQMYTMTTGLMPSVFTIITLVTYLAMPNNLIQTGISLVLGKVYSNSLIATLNFRQTSLRAWESNNRYTVHLSELPQSMADSNTLPESVSAKQENRETDICITSTNTQTLDVFV